MTVTVTSGTSASAPFEGSWESAMDGFASAAAISGSQGGSVPTTINGFQIIAAGTVTVFGVKYFLIELEDGATDAAIDGVTVTLNGGTPHTYAAAGVHAFAPTGSSSIPTFGLSTGGPIPGPVWIWTSPVADFANGQTTTLDFPVSITLTIPDFTATEAILDWVDTAGNTTYEVRRNSALIATVNVLTYIDADLQPSTVYAYTVTGVQHATVSNTVSITTPDLTDEFNCECETTSTFSTLAQLRTRLAIQVGYAAQAANLPAGMVAECNEYLFSAQNQLYMKYKSLRTERMFRWTMVPGQRYYSLTAAEGSCVKQIDPKRVTWVGFEDLNQAWYQLIAGINPLWYTRANITTGWPTRFEIRSCIEVFPAPQAAYTLWIKAHFQLEPFAVDSDRTSIDDELVLLFAIANLKSAKGKPDWQRAMNQATARLHDLTSGNHVLRRYVPGTTTDSPATPPRFLPLNGAPP